MTSSPPPTDDMREGVDVAAEEAPASEPTPWPEAEPAPRSGPAPAPDPEPFVPAAPEPEPAVEPEPEPVGASGDGQTDLNQMSAVAEDLINRSTPWDSRTSWDIVLGEGIAAAIVGLLFIFKPLGGSSTTLQIVGLILLAGALITSFQLWRHQLRPEIEQLASFRAGSGATVGLVVIVATFFVPVTDPVVAALATVVGIGFFIFGATGIAGTFVRMQMDVPLPIFGLVANAVLALVGLLLVFAGAGGAGAVAGIFNLLGVLLIVAGLALAGRAYLLRQDEGR